MYWIIDYYIDFIDPQEERIYEHLVQDLLLKYFSNEYLTSKQKKIISSYGIPNNSNFKINLLEFIKPGILKSNKPEYVININYEDLEDTYNKKGLYIFSNINECLYVGKSINLGSRIETQLRNQKIMKDATILKVYFFDTMTQTDIYEIVAINFFKPRCNESSKYDEKIIYKFKKKSNIRLKIKVSKEKEFFPIEIWDFGCRENNEV